MHTPVLLHEVMSFAREVEPMFILDATFGRGGHTSEFLRQFPRAKLFALDRDPEAIAYGEERYKDEIVSGRLTLKYGNFHELSQQGFAPESGFDVILADLGVSSPQLDVPARGFSFYHDGPLDMRMDPARGFSAADVVNSRPEVELIDLFSRYGEVRRPQRVVAAISKQRKMKPFATTRELAGLIEQVEGWQRRGHHPATRYFLALRMAVNNELSGLEESLPDLMRALSQKGRLIVITFHSLEDRIIKYAFREASQWGRPLIKKVVVPSREEQRDNPRARSAKLRVFQREVRGDSAAFGGDPSLL